MTGYRTKNDRIYCTWNDRISFQEWPDMLYLEWPDFIPRMTGYSVPGMNGYRTKNDRICCTLNDRISYQEWPDILYLEWTDTVPYQEWPDMLYLEWPDIVPRMTGYAVPGMNRTGCLWPAVLSSAAWSKYRVLKSKIDHKPQKIKFHFFNSASKLITYIKKHLLSNFVIFLYEILIYWKNMRCG